MMPRNILSVLVLFLFLAMPNAQALTPEELTPYLEQFRSGDRNMRSAAADALVKEGRAIIPVLWEAWDRERSGAKELTRQQVFVLRGILLTFVRLGDSSVIPSVKKLLDVPDPEAVGYVTQTICRVSDGNKDVVHELLAELAKENRTVMEISEKSLGFDEDTRLTAPHVIKGMGITGGIEEAYDFTTPALIDAINDPDAGIQLMSLELLRNVVVNLGPPDRQKIKGKIEQLSSDESAEVRDAAKELLRVMGN